jgi:hypothetical protein
VDDYVARWAGPDGRKIGQHERRTIRSRLWPVLQRGYASTRMGTNSNRSSPVWDVVPRTSGPDSVDAEVNGKAEERDS